MAKNILPVNFQDDILSESMDNRRRYQIINNPDGTVSFVDVTEYNQVGSYFGQAQINATNEAVNESADKNRIIDDPDDLMANTQEGMLAGALAVKDIKNELTGNLQNIDTLLGGGLYMKNWRIEANETVFTNGQGVTLSIEAPADNFIFVYDCNIKCNTYTELPNIVVSADFESIIKTGFGVGVSGGGRGGRTEIIKIDCAKGDIVSVSIPSISVYPTAIDGKISAVSIY